MDESEEERQEFLKKQEILAKLREWLEEFAAERSASAMNLDLKYLLGTKPIGSFAEDIPKRIRDRYNKNG